MAPALVNPAFTDLASGSGSPTVTRTFPLNNAATYLHAGTNVIAVQAFNVLAANSDFFFDMELRIPTPVAGLWLANAGLRQCERQAAGAAGDQAGGTSPQQPLAGQDVVVTAKVTDPDGVGAVELRYQTVNAGTYIPRKNVTSVSGPGGANPLTVYADNPAYENPANWTSVAMHDDGLNGDAVAGDFIYAAVIPGAVQVHRRLIRYRVFAADTAGSPSSIQVPYPDDEQSNFAYFCYNGVPDWTGSLRATADAAGAALPPVTYPGSLLASLPTYHLIALANDVDRCQYQSGFNGGLFYGTMIYDGKVYDHILFEVRGEFSTYNTGKNKWRFHFNRTHDFEGRDNYGNPYRPRNSFSFDTCACPWATVNRGMAGLDTTLNHRIYQLAGIPSANTNYVHWRVIDSATENNPANQFDTDLWGLLRVRRRLRGDFIESHGLPDGNLYRLGSGTPYQRHQSPNLPGDGSDWATFSSQSTATPLPGVPFWQANMDLPAYYMFHALNRFIGNVDLRGGANHFFYHRESDGRWIRCHGTLI